MSSLSKSFSRFSESESLMNRKHISVCLKWNEGQTGFCILTSLSHLSSYLCICFLFISTFCASFCATQSLLISEILELKINTNDQSKFALYTHQNKKYEVFINIYFFIFIVCFHFFLFFNIFLCFHFKFIFKISI